MSAGVKAGALTDYTKHAPPTDTVRTVESIHLLKMNVLTHDFSSDDWRRSPPSFATRKCLRRATHWSLHDDFHCIRVSHENTSDFIPLQIWPVINERTDNRNLILISKLRFVVFLHKANHKMPNMANNLSPEQQQILQNQLLVQLESARVLFAERYRKWKSPSSSSAGLFSDSDEHFAAYSSDRIRAIFGAFVIFVKII